MTFIQLNFFCRIASCVFLSSFCGPLNSGPPIDKSNNDCTVKCSEIEFKNVSRLQTYLDPTFFRFVLLYLPIALLGY